MSVNAEMTPVKSGEERWRRMVEEVNSFMIYLIHCKNLYKCHHAPPPITVKVKKSMPLLLFSISGRVVSKEIVWYRKEDW
jgi:hypothetical protein